MTQPTTEQMIKFLSMRITAGMMNAGYYRGDAMAVEFVDMNMAIRAALRAKALQKRETSWLIECIASPRPLWFTGLPMTAGQPLNI